MKPIEMALAGAGVLLLVAGIGLGWLAASTVAEPRPGVAPPAQPATPAKPENIFAEFAPAPAAPPAPAGAACPAGFVDQGGVCVGQESVDYQADARRRQEARELGQAVAEELRGD